MIMLCDYGVDLALARLGIQGAETIVDDLAIGILAGFMSYAWASYKAEKQARTRERLITVAELNHHVRNALQLISSSVETEDDRKRAPLIEEGVNKILARFKERISRQGVESLLEQHHSFSTIYNSIASSYDFARFGHPAGRYDLEETRTLVKDLVSALLSGRLNDWLALDVGAGTGKIALALAQMGGTVFALDSAIGMLQQGSASSLEMGIGDNLILTNACAENLPYRDNSFDIIFSFRFLHLFPVEAYADFLREMIRVVKPGGYVVVEVKNPWYGIGVYRLKDLFRSINGERNFSSYIGSKHLRVLGEQAGGVQRQSIAGLLLPKGWWLREHRHLAQIARVLARGPLKFTSAHLVAIFRKDGLA